MKKESSSDSDSEDEKPSKAPPVSAKKSTPAKPAESSSSSGDSSESEDEKPITKPTPAKTTPAAKKVETTTPAGDGGEHKLYIKGLPWKVTEKEIKDFFKDCGKLTR